ncbi:MAG: hypothetical protein ACFFD2_23045 [Promethearchaeota archaeon]
MDSKNKEKAKLYTKFPISSVLIYDSVTTLHYLAGGFGIILGYIFSWIGILFGLIYFLFAFVQMYILMPLWVCPNCVYYRLEDSRCVSGLNKISKKIAKEGNPDDFPKRGEGVLCYNNIYMASFFIPIIAIIPALILNFSFLVLGLLLSVIGLLVFRFFVIFPKIACLHCNAKYKCPVAEKIGVCDK